MGLSIWEGTKAQGVLDALDHIGRELHIIAADSNPAFSDWDKLHEIVKEGLAPEFFSIGDQIQIAYNDGSNDYTLPWDIVDFRNVTLHNGDVVPGMVLQSHYAMQPVQFDAREAFKYCAEALPAGTYYINVPTAWSKFLAGNYQFTLTQDVPAGGQLVFNQNLPDVDPSTLTVSSYANATSTSAIETVNVTSGNSGTSLGSFIAAGNSDLWSMQAAAYGYNRWSKSALRQFLNSDAAATAWWTPQHNYDRPPTELATKRGFMAGFSADFLAVIKPVKVQTATNTITDGGVTDVTYDTFFPASLEEEYIEPQASGVEGAYFPYWKDRLDLQSPQGTGSANANPAHIRYGYDAKTTAQVCRLRSAYRGYAYYTWIVTTAGLANAYAALYSYRCAPACVIC